MTYFISMITLVAVCQAFSATRRFLLETSCGGTFIGDNSKTYSCQHAIDKGWALDCATVSGWDNANCKASPTKETCPGTFIGDSGNTYTCQHAIDEGWASDCATVSGWNNADCTESLIESCPGTFVGDNGNTYNCQHAIDQGWAPDCETVSGWKNADCAGSVHAPPGAETSMTVMSYNTEYTGYPSRVNQYGAKIREVGAAVVGTQECQDKSRLASASGYELVPRTGPQNPIFYDPEQVSFLASGYMNIPRDNYAQRTITWAKFRRATTEFIFFNTHLPHNHGEARNSNTHARIAKMLVNKRKEIGAESMPTVIVGDCNPFASNGASKGSFESKLASSGFDKVYEAKGNPGHRGLDKIFISTHWRASNGADRGTGSSDHPAISVDLNLR